MTHKSQLLVLLCAGLLSFVAAECPNACSAHGKCGAYDMCTCFRNWMSNDCSERVCQFGLAHVDTPKGDLDASSGKLTGPDTVVAVNDFIYRFGTTEQYPATTDIAGNVVTNAAHEYRECSNKGICDRATGTCACFEGYEGSACQRASCPSGPGGVCSGHGVCQSVSEIAAADHSNIYKLWDEDATMGCVCDGGYTGADCSQRLCKVGTDPLYFDNNATLRYTNFTFQFYTQYVASPSTPIITGNYSIVFYDAYGEDWETDPIPITATCDNVIAALEGLPNNVIPAGSVRCYKSQTPQTTANVYGQDATGVEPIRDTWMKVHHKFTVAFPKTPGKLKQIRINKYLDGARPTLFTDETTSTLGWHIYPNGFIGENVDLVPDRCHGVIVSLGAAAGSHYLTGLDATETKLLKACLGTADSDSTNNQEVYNWDFGSFYHPHLIKLQDATQFTNIYSIDAEGDVFYDPQLQYRPRSLLCDSTARNAARFGTQTGGSGATAVDYCLNDKAPAFYSVLFYDATQPTYPFRLMTRAAADYDATTPFYIYTTQGQLSLVSEYAGVYSYHHSYDPAKRVAAHYTDTLKMVDLGTTYDSVNYRGDMSCENNPVGQHGANECLNKGDLVMVLDVPLSGSTLTSTADAAALSANPIYPNIYTVEKIFRERRSNTTAVGTDTFNEVERLQLVLDYSLNAAFAQDAPAYVYKFFPPTNNADGGYLHTGPCATRGLCNADTGLCECFNGYNRDDCSCNTCNTAIY